MRVLLIAVMILFLAVSGAEALLNDNSVHNDNTNVNSNSSSSYTYSRNDNENIIITDTDVSTEVSNEQAQGQLQGQLQGQMQGQVMGGQETEQANIQDTKVKVDGDDIEYFSSAFSLQASPGTNPMNVITPFGGIGLSETEEYKRCIEALAVVKDMQLMGYISDEEAKEEAKVLFTQLKEANRPKRFLGFLWQTRGKHALNGLGLLAWDDMVSKFRFKKHKSDDTEVWGNAGEFN